MLSRSTAAIDSAIGSRTGTFSELTATNGSAAVMSEVRMLSGHVPGQVGEAAVAARTDAVGDALLGLGQRALGGSVTDLLDAQILLRVSQPALGLLAKLALLLSVGLGVVVLAMTIRAVPLLVVTASCSHVVGLQSEDHTAPHALLGDQRPGLGDGRSAH